MSSIDLIVENVNAALGSVRSDMDNMSRRIRKLEAVDLVPTGGGAPVPHAIPVAAGFHSGALPVTDLDGWVQGRIIRGGAGDWEVYDASTANFILQGDGLDVVSVAFDWDNMSAGAGADMVHDHSAPGEGGVLPVGSITAHPLLGAQHSGTVAQAPTRGSLVYGNAAGNWDELVIGAAFTHLESDGTDIAYQVDLTMQDDATIGLNGGGNLDFNSTPATDVLNFASCNVGVNEVAPGANLHVSAPTATDVGLIVQTTDDNAAENLTEWHDSGGNTLGGVQAYGVPFCGLNIASNTLFGLNAGAGGLVTGFRNTFLGVSTGVGVTTGEFNVFVGSVVADLGAVTGDFNVGLGSLTLRNLTSGNANFALGLGALAALTTANENVAIGKNTLSQHTTGLGRNTGVGDSSLAGLTTGYTNTAIGTTALGKLTTAIGNIGIGTEAGKGPQTGNYNVFIGFNAGGGNPVTNRTKSTYIGYQTGLTQHVGNNTLVIHNADSATPLILGDFTAGLTFHSQAAAAVAVAIQGAAMQSDHLLILQTSAPDPFFESSTGLTGSTTTWNQQGLDINFHVEAFGVVDAFQVDGAAGQITLGALGAGFVQSSAGGVLSSAAIGAGDLPAHTHSGAGQGGSLAVGTTDTDATAGSVFFAGVAGVIQEDNGSLFWDNGNDRLGIGTNAPGVSLEVSGGHIGIRSSASAATVNSALALIYATDGGGGAYPFDEVGNLILQPSTSANRDILFATREDATTTTVRMTILQDGNVGIGTNAPLVNVHALDTAANVVMRLETDLVNGSASIQFENDVQIWQVGTNSADNFQIRDSTGPANVMILEAGAPANSIYVDAAGQVGINTAGPVAVLDVNGNGNFLSADNALVGTSTGANKAGVIGRDNNAAGNGVFGDSSGTSGVGIWGNIAVGGTGASIAVYGVQNGSGWAAQFIGGDVGINTATVPDANGGACIIFDDNGAALDPGAGTAGLYAQDVAGTVEMFAVDEAGNAAQLTPHDSLTGEWIFYTKNVKTGRVLRVNMEQMVRHIEEFVGRQFLYEWEEN